jgi:hypothetical protein
MEVVDHLQPLAILPVGIERLVPIELNVGWVSVLV